MTESNKKRALLIECSDDIKAAKTAINLLRYDLENVVAVITVGNEKAQSAVELLSEGACVPVVSSVSEIADADQLVLGTTPPGGRIPASWRQVIQSAIVRGWDVVSGMHDFLGDDPALVELADQHNARLVDVRKTDFSQVATRHEIRESCLRIHTVGHDSNVGKMVVSFEITRALLKRGHDAQFVPTGQTGILLAGHGIPMDAVVSDFLNGAAEELVRRNQDHDILLIEGQGSIVNPMFSGVTLGLLHGCMPDGLILCYQPDRTTFRHTEISIPSLDRLARLYEDIASINHPCSVIGVGMNSSSLGDAQASEERDRVQSLLGIPVVDVIRDGGAEGFIEPILELKDRIGK